MRAKTIYLVSEYGGEWEDKWETVLYAFDNLAYAERAKSKLQEKIKRICGYADYDEGLDPCGVNITEISLMEDGSHEQAHWVPSKHVIGKGWWECSNCGYLDSEDDRYCPGCGYRMIKEKIK